jgi:hypothetical protein
MFKIISDKYKLYKNRKKFKCTLRLTHNECGGLKHMTYKELCVFLKENEDVKFYNFFPSHIENKEEFDKRDHITVLYKNNKFYFMGPLIICKSYYDLQDVGFELRFEGF